MVSTLALYFENTTSNPADVYSFICKMSFEKNGNKTKSVSGGVERHLAMAKPTKKRPRCAHHFLTSLNLFSELKRHVIFGFFSLLRFKPQKLPLVLVRNDDLSLEVG